MSNIYCHEDVLDFTNPFLNYEQGYQAPRKIAAIPVSLKTVLPVEPLTRQGYPRGESQGDSSGRVNLLSFLIGCADWFSIGFINLRDAGSFPLSLFIGGGTIITLLMKRGRLETNTYLSTITTRGERRRGGTTSLVLIPLWSTSGVTSRQASIVTAVSGSLVWGIW